MEFLHHINQALKAHNLFARDVDYIVKDGQVIIVDEFTGRLMPGRRFSDGLHQALEAKENVKIERENQTLATVTFQNYFRMYKKLAGMTGTADTEAMEFRKIYNLDVVVIPTNRPLIRTNYPDLVYRTEKEKFKAVVKEIEELYATGKPVLVGTLSIDKSERLAEMLKRKGIPHHVLNAKIHEREAEIVAQAGRYKAVTISTNMAGRGTDILLGGNPSFLARVLTQGKGRRRKSTTKALAEAKQICEKEKEQVIKAGRPPHPRNGAARIAPDRQPASRPFRTAGGPRLLEILRLSRRRDHADFRLGPHLAAPREAGNGRGHAHRALPHLQRPSRTPRPGWNRTTSTSGSTSSTMTT